MNHDSTYVTRKCGPVAGAFAGAALCISAVPVSNAAVQSGNITGSNPASVFTFNTTNTFAINLFSSRAQMSIIRQPGAPLFVQSAGGSLAFNSAGPYVAALNSGVTVSGAMAGGFDINGYVFDNLSGKFLAVGFSDGGNRFGWVRITTPGDQSSFSADLWGFEDTGATIRTADETVSTKVLALSSGKTRLTWTNANEEGVSRYEVQAKGTDGAWSAVDSDTPGAGTYATTLPGDREYRLVLELTDGETTEVDF